MYSCHVRVGWRGEAEEKQLRILVADSVTKVRFALGVMLRQTPGLEVVGEASEMAGLLDQLRDTSPDVVLLDWKLRGQTADGALQSIRSARPGAYVIVLGNRPEVGLEAMESGADAFVSRVDHPDRLMAAIEAARASASGDHA